MSKPSSSKPRLTEGSGAVRLLRLKFEEGDLHGGEMPKAVWESEPVFQKYDLNRFRTRFCRMRDEFSAKAGNEGQELPKRCTAAKDNSASKRICIPEDATGAEFGDTDYGSGVELLSNHLSFIPLFLPSSWIEPQTTTKRATVAIILPSGVGAGDFNVAIVDDGEYLELTVNWPAALMDPFVMHRKWLKSDGSDHLEPYHPRILGFENALKQLRIHNTDLIKSVARIPLPFKVQTHVTMKHNLAFGDPDREEVKMVYVDLTAHVEEYGAENDNNAFEKV